MTVRRLLMVCVLALAAILPLVGCGDKAGTGGGTGGGTGTGSSNTTAE